MQAGGCAAAVGGGAEAGARWGRHLPVEVERLLGVCVHTLQSLDPWLRDDVVELLHDLLPCTHQHRLMLSMHCTTRWLVPHTQDRRGPKVSGCWYVTEVGTCGHRAEQARQAHRMPDKHTACASADTRSCCCQCTSATAASVLDTHRHAVDRTLAAAHAAGCERDALHRCKG